MQLHAVGYAGTMGARFVPAMVIDRHAMPPRASAALSERLVLVPHAYQANDHLRLHKLRPHVVSCFPTYSRHLLTDQVNDHRRYGTHAPLSSSREANGGGGGGGGGGDGLGLLNLNQLYKLEPSTLGLWCGVLRAAPRARLWLLQPAGGGEAALRSEAAACGVAAANRLRFAPLVFEVATHLRRVGSFGLVLDTPEYNCHTTGTDALWAGLPLVTASGEQMASRVAGSLLRASGAATGVVRSLREYHTLAAFLVNGADGTAAPEKAAVGSWGTTGASTASPPPRRCRWPVVADVV